MALPHNQFQQHYQPQQQQQSKNMRYVNLQKAKFLMFISFKTLTTSHIFMDSNFIYHKIFACVCRNLYSIDGQTYPPVYYSAANLQDQSQHPPYIPSPCKFLFLPPLFFLSAFVFVFPFTSLEPRACLIEDSLLSS